MNSIALKTLTLVSLLGLANSAFARGEWDSFRSTKAEDLFGKPKEEAVAKSDRYIVRSEKLSAEAKAFVSRCSSVNTSIEMTQFNSMLLTPNITVATLRGLYDNSLVSIVAQGKVLNQGKSEVVFMALYNDGTCSVDKFKKDYFGYRPASDTGSGNGNSAPAPGGTAPVPPTQSCSISVKISEESSDRGIVAVACDLQAPATTRVFSGTSILCDNSGYVGPQATKQCLFTRNPNAPLDLTIVVNSDNLEFSKSVHLQKEPTFNYPVRAWYVDTLPEMSPAPQEESVPFRGRRFESIIKVSVQDNDILEEDPQNEIRVKLVNLKTGQVVQESKISTGRSVEFKLNGFYEEPRLWGKPHWDDDKPLQPGENIFAVVVSDAYKKNDSEPLRLENVTVHIPQLTPKHK